MLVIWRRATGVFQGLIAAALVHDQLGFVNHPAFLIASNARAILLVNHLSQPAETFLGCVLQLDQCFAESGARVRNGGQRFGPDRLGCVLPATFCFLNVCYHFDEALLPKFEQILSIDS